MRMNENTAKLLDLEDSSLFKSSSVSEPDIVPQKLAPGEAQLHRSVASLFVEGNPPKRIAQLLTIEEGNVKTLLRQSHTQEVIKELVSVTGQGDVVKNILAATQVENILTLIELRDSSAPANVRRQCCMDLANMYRGKRPVSEGEEDSQERLGNKVSELDKQITELTSKFSR